MKFVLLSLFVLSLLAACAPANSPLNYTYYPVDRTPKGYMAATQPQQPTKICYNKVIWDDYGRETVACVSQTGTGTFVQ